MHDSIPAPRAAVDAPAAMPKKTPEKSSDKPPKTPGERYYDRMQFITADAFIVTASALLAYVARYPDKVAGVRNYLKDFQGWLDAKFLENRLFTLKDVALGENKEFGKRLAGALSATTLTMWGGNLFAPILKRFENHHEEIVTRYNEKHGTPQDVADGHARLKDKPKQTWGDIIKGRVVGFFIVSGSFIGVDTLLGKTKKPVTNPETGIAKPAYQLDQYEERVGRFFARLGKDGETIAKTPLDVALTAAQKENKAYRFGKMVALDIFAASAAILVWKVVSRLSAKTREKETAEPAPMAAAPVTRDRAAPEREVEELPAPQGQTPALKIHAVHHAEPVVRSVPAAAQHL